jgi:hypothetical protein
MPFGSLLGGFLAKGGLRLPLLIGGTIATVIALLSLRFLLHGLTPSTIEEAGEAG